ncbi:hypothetical protein PIIN_00011 [Serendipita indica DSM 11827]|uniref:Uncharacterized protein n=1 Tax=Serendipita indica (strain DSM 11827) TaxID=1109443 RepID=G4T501_SERID|nr:hypothetical protein PIIN_00011 [Serendipita indica DSM 11827]
MSRLSFVAALFALVASVNAQSTSVANPFSGIPPLSGLPVCNTECAAVAQIQSSWNGDYSSACTTTFANSLTSCMTCVANSSLGPILLTPENEQLLSSAITNYENSCQQAGSPVTINVSSILAGPTGSTSSGTGTARATSSTASNTAAPGSNNGASTVHIGFGALVGATALVFSGLY